MTIQNNKNRLTEILNKINNLPDAGGGSGGFPNGTEWTQSNVTSGGFKIYYGKGIWVACDQSPGNGIFYSRDGKTWVQSNITYGYFVTLLYANGLWVASDDEYGIYHSEDGITWTRDEFDGIIIRLRYDAGIWLADAEEPFSYYYSTDGITWIESDRPSCDKIEYANGIWVSSNEYSTDGITWITASTKGTTVPYYANGRWYKYYMDSRNSKSFIYYSIDGITWTSLNHPYSSWSADMSHFYYADGLWLVYGFEGVLYSNDGIVWSNSNLSENVLRISNANGIWVMVADEALYYSNDGILWISSNLTSSTFDFNESDASSLQNVNGIWLFTTASNEGIWYSIDGKIWSIAINGSGCIIMMNNNGIWVMSTYRNGLYYSITWELPKNDNPYGSDDPDDTTEDF